jgi:SulP family sulfate permease
VAGLLLPEAVAYAGLARLSVVHALTAMVVGLTVYALFGRSRFAIVAPTSSTATLSAAAAMSLSGGAVAGADPQAYAQALFALVLVAGSTLMLLAAARQGQLSAYVSRPVLRGFAFALAITIVVKQLPDALGLALPVGTSTAPLHLLLYVLKHADQWHGTTMVVALGAAAAMVLFRRWRALPASMLVIVLAMAAAHWLDLLAMGVQEVGAVEPPAWRLSLPQMPLDAWLQATELAFGLVILVFAESWGSIRNLALARGDEVNANRELMVLGACNVGSALMQGMPVGAGFSASTANAAAGATSRWASVVALGVIGLALAFALPALHLLPRPVLAVLTLGVMHGMLAAIGLSLLDALRRFSQPVVHELGELSATRNFVVMAVHSNASRVPGLLILRPEEPLFFASAERVMAELLRRVRAVSGVHTLVISLEESPDMDSTAVESLIELRLHLSQLGVKLLLSHPTDPVRELLAHCDPQGLGEPTRTFFSVADAVRSLRTPRESL